MRVFFSWLHGRVSSRYRLILDETLSFCVLGPTGRGLTEHLGLPVMEVDILVVTLEYGLASVGGLCLGSTEVVDHQRLSGAGYCFRCGFRRRPEIMIEQRRMASAAASGLFKSVGLAALYRGVSK